MYDAVRKDVLERAKDLVEKGAPVNGRVGRLVCVLIEILK